MMSKMNFDNKKESMTFCVWKLSNAEHFSDALVMHSDDILDHTKGNMSQSSEIKFFPSIFVRFTVPL